MDLNLAFAHLQYAIPVGIVLVCAFVVFVFGFKKAEQPRFAQLSDAERKQAAKKRARPREKKNVNGHIGNEKASPVKKTSPAKNESSKKTKGEESEKAEKKQQEDNRKSKSQDNKVGKENKVEHVKNKKNLKNLQHEKPVDFDDGDWEQAYSRKDKKNKKKEEEASVQSAKSKKSTKKSELIDDVKESKDNIAQEIINEGVKEKSGGEKPILVKTEIKDKSAKDTQNKELKEKNEMVVILNRIPNDVLEKHQTSTIAAKEEKNNKSKKSKKGTENVPSETVTSNDESPKIPLAKPVKEIDTSVKEDAKVEKTENIEEKKVPAFDELGDIWTEAKPQRKSKKKSRKDN